MKVLVLGGTGAMGTHLVRELVQKGIDTTVTTRRERSSKDNLKFLHGNAKDLNFINNILDEHWDVIIDFMIYSTNEFQNRIELLLNSTGQYIFLSSSRIYANYDVLIKEDSPRLLDVLDDNEFLSTDEYALTKARQENILRNCRQKNWTIIRPYITYSEQRFQLGVLEKEEWLYRALKGRTIVFSKDIAKKFTTMTYGKDVSNGILSLIGNPKARCNDFNITNNESLKWEEILTLYLTIIEKKTGFKPKVVLKNLNEFLKYHPKKYQIEYDRLYNRQFDNSKINTFIETNKFLLAENGIESCLSEFINNPNFKNINWILEALKDKETKEYTTLKEINGMKQKIKYLLYRYLPIKVMSKQKSMYKNGNILF